MEEFLRSLGINGNFTDGDNGSIVMDIKDSNEYGSIYSKLDKCEELEEDPDASNVTMESSSIQFKNDDYIITLIGDFDGDNYRLVMMEL